LELQDASFALHPTIASARTTTIYEGTSIHKVKSACKVGTTARKGSPNLLNMPTTTLDHLDPTKSKATAMH
jgi:hypothetical protein